MNQLRVYLVESGRVYRHYDQWKWLDGNVAEELILEPLVWCATHDRQWVYNNGCALRYYPFGLCDRTDQQVFRLAGEVNIAEVHDG